MNAVAEADSGEVIRNPGPPLTKDQVKARRLMSQGEQKHTCLVGGSRSGKTTVIVRQIVMRALKAANSRHLMARYRANALRASVLLDTFPKVMRTWYPHISYEVRRQDGFIHLPYSDSQLWLGGLDEGDRVEKILGQEYATIYAGECSQIPYSTILTLRTRLAQPGTGLKLRGFYDLNPTSTQHWTNVEFGEKRDPISGVPLKDPHNFARMFLNPEGNAANLDPSYLESLRNMPAAYRQRFYEGAYVVDVDGAIWTTDLLETCREEAIEPDAKARRLQDFIRIVVAVDPSGAQSKLDIKSDEIGIVCSGLRHDGTAVVLQDATMKGSPKEWGRAAVACYRKWHADVIVAEANYGGAMVQSTIQAVGTDAANVPVKLVNASRGKVIRAEPVAALYESNKVYHAGRFPEMESQMCLFSRSGYKGDRSPDRADALVWSLTELMLGEKSSYTLAHIS